MYMKTNSNDIPEGKVSEDDADPEMSLRDLATLMIQGGEVLLITCCNFLNYIFLKRRKVFMQLFNELLNYNKKLSGKDY